MIENAKNELVSVIESIVAKTQEMDYIWDWPCGVAYYGICKAYEVTGNESYLEFLKRRIDLLIELGLPTWTVNTCTMGHTLLDLYNVTGDNKYLEIIQSKIEYLKNDALRFGDGVLQHVVSDRDDFPQQAWADTLFMAAYFMLRVGVSWGDSDLINDALNQFYWHINYLQDSKTGLWFHGYDYKANNHMSGIHWARANAWGAYTMAMVGQILPKCYLYPKYLDIVGALNEQIAALKKVQTADGLWRTILDDDESYEEISASCGIAAAMAVRSNPLYYKNVERAFKSILLNVTSTGKVMNVSAGTAVMENKDGYKQITKDWIQGWGQGLALVFFASLFKLGKTNPDGAL